MPRNTRRLPKRGGRDQDTVGLETAYYEAQLECLREDRKARANDQNTERSQGVLGQASAYPS